MIFARSCRVFEYCIAFVYIYKWGHQSEHHLKTCEDEATDSVAARPEHFGRRDVAKEQKLKRIPNHATQASSKRKGETDAPPARARKKLYYQCDKVPWTKFIRTTILFVQKNRNAVTRLASQCRSRTTQLDPAPRRKRSIAATLLQTLVRTPGESHVGNPEPRRKHNSIRTEHASPCAISLING